MLGAGEACDSSHECKLAATEPGQADCAFFGLSGLPGVEQGLAGLRIGRFRAPDSRRVVICRVGGAFGGGGAGDAAHHNHSAVGQGGDAGVPVAGRGGAMEGGVIKGLSGMPRDGSTATAAAAAAEVLGTIHMQAHHSGAGMRMRCLPTLPPPPPAQRRQRQLPALHTQAHHLGEGILVVVTRLLP